MVETITPVVHGGRRSRWIADVGLHVLGATLAAAVFGAALGAFGALLGAPFGAAGLLLVAAVASGYAVAETTGLRVPVPQARRQVPDWWRTFFSMPVFSFLYGAGLGVGFLTYLSRGTLVAVTAACVASGRPLVGLALMAPFGLARSSVVLVSATATSAERAASLVDRLVEASRSAWWRVANAGVLAAIAVTAVAAAASAPTGGVRRLLPAALGVVFGWGAAMKLARRREWRRSLADHHLPHLVESVARFAVPTAEGIVAVTAILGYARFAGVVAAGLLVAFTASAVRARRFADGQVPCGCFGGRRSRDWKVLVARNLVLLGLAVATAVAGAGPRIELPGTPTGSDLLPAVLATAGLLVAGWVAVAVALAFRPGTRREPT
jgi:hypothetical protein